MKGDRSRSLVPVFLEAVVSGYAMRADVEGEAAGPADPDDHPALRALPKDPRKVEELPLWADAEIGLVVRLLEEGYSIDDMVDALGLETDTGAVATLVTRIRALATLPRRGRRRR